MSLIIDGTNGVTFNDSSLQGAAASPYVLKNRIINGAMMIDQRNAGASVNNVSAAVTYTLDRWSYFGGSGASKFSVQQQTSIVPTGFTYATKITSLSAYTVGSTEENTFFQQIEGYNLADLSWGTANAKTITFSFWVYSSLTGTFGGAIRNGAADRSYPFSYTINSANTWEQKSITVTGDTTGTWATNNTSGMIAGFSIGNGSGTVAAAGAWTAGNKSGATGCVSLLGTNSATLYITGVQLEIGTSATPFERRLYNQELANCQRYYEKSYAQGTTPGTAQSYPAYGTYFNGMSAVSGQKVIILPFKVTKRTSPTMTYYDAAGTSGKITTVDIGGTNTNNVAIALSFVNDSMYAAGSANGIHTGLYYDWTSSAEL